MNSKNYTIQNIEVIQGFEQDQYGKTWYNVKFQEDAETYMWLLRDKPDVGEVVYGHVEPTKSGKKLRFKKDPLPEVAQQVSTDQFTPKSSDKPVWKDNSKEITLGLVFKVFCATEGMMPNDDKHWAYIKYCTQMLLDISGELSGGEAAKTGIEKFKETKKIFGGGEFSDADVPEFASDEVDHG